MIVREIKVIKTERFWFLLRITDSQDEILDMISDHSCKLSQKMFIKHLEQYRLY